MATTTINVSSVRQSIDSMTKLIAERNDAINDVAKQNKFLSDVWDGTAKDEFVKGFEKTKKEMMEFNKALQDYVNMMKESVNKFVQHDEILRNSFRS